MAAMPSLRRASVKRGSTAKGISFSAFAGIASLIAGILLLPVVLATVGPAAYGIWLFLLAAASFLFFLDLGLGIAIIHFLSRSRSGDETANPNRVASTAHAWAFAASLVAISLFLVVSSNYTNQGVSTVSHKEFDLMVICGVALLTSMVVRPMSSVLFGAGFLHIERTNQLIGVAVRIVGTLAACWLGGGIVGVVIAETAALVTPTFLSALRAHRMQLVQIRLRYISTADLKMMMSYSLRSFSVSMIGASVLQFGTLIIGVLGSSNQVAYFNAAFRIYVSVRQVIGWLTDPFRSVLSRLYVKDERRAADVLYDLLFVSFMASVFGCVLLLVTLPVVLKVWLGETVPTGEVTATASALLAGLILNALHIPLIPASDAAGSPGAFFKHQAFWLASYAALSFLLFPTLGILGTALAMTIPLPFIEFAYLITAKRTVKLDFEIWFKRVIGPVLPVLILGLIFSVGAALRQETVWLVVAGAGFIASSLLTIFLTRSSWSYHSILESLRIEA